MNRLAAILPVANVMVDVDATSKKRAFEHAGLLFENQHAIARAQMHGFGGVLSFELAGGFAAVRRLLPRCQLLIRAATLGTVDTLLGVPSTTSHVECSEQERIALGIPGGLVRCSVGIEDIADIIADVEQALAKVA